ncbi:hypothetical protein CRUP_000642, partial [Coryphaenoides rupestris]
MRVGWGGVGREEKDTVQSRFVEMPTSTGQALMMLGNENRPSGTSVLQLSVTDRDATHNGPPFHFAIVEGNDGDAFQISQQGALVAVGALDKKAREHYLLRAQ